MRMLAPILFGTLFAIAVSMYSAQLINSWVQRADQVFLQARL